MQVTVEMAIRNAAASLRMEGMKPSEECLRECRRLLTGEITHEQYMERIRKEYSEVNNG